MNDDEASRTYGNTFFNTGNSIFFYPKELTLLWLSWAFRSTLFLNSFQKNFSSVRLRSGLIRSITSTEETGDSVDVCADQFETSTNPPPLLLGQTQGIEPSLVPGEWVIWPLPGWSGKFKPEMSSLTSLDNPGLTTWFDRCHLSHSNLRSWRSCFCVWEYESLAANPPFS